MIEFVTGKNYSNFPVNRHLKDLNTLFIGCEKCESGKSFGPAIRPYTLIHYVRSGSGKLHTGADEYAVHTGEAFVIYPGEVTMYEADRRDPWTYVWVAFDGELAERFKEAPRIIGGQAEIFEEILGLCDKEGCEYIVTSLLFRLFSALFSSAGVGRSYVKSVKSQIKMLYMNKIRVSDIASELGLDRRYLSRIFKSEVGMSIQDYIAKVRIDMSKKYLMDGYSVAQAALLSGYEDVSDYSKLFKKREGVSPFAWRKKQISPEG